VRVTIKLGNVRLNVEQWRSVDHVDIRNVEDTAFDAQESDHGQANGGRTRWRARGEDPTLLFIEKGSNQ
jgi:hypothetical protein